MTEDLKRLDRMRSLIFKPALILAFAGVAVGVAGWLTGHDDGALGEAVMTGAGTMMALFSWAGWRAGRRLYAGAEGRADREQAARAWTLLALTFAGLVLSVVSAFAAHRMVTGVAQGMEWLGALNAVLYAVLVPVMVMNWDAQAWKLKKWLEDELVRTLQAKALTAAFFVLLFGASAAYLVGLWRPEWAVVALPIVLWSAAATASVRFVLLGRSYDG